MHDMVIAFFEKSISSLFSIFENNRNAYPRATLKGSGIESHSSANKKAPSKDGAHEPAEGFPPNPCLPK
jgi:hypothetical protein